MLFCRDLQLIYKDGRNTKTVLDQMDLEIKRGENIVLLGPSGSGKSSLLNLLSCLRKPTHGEIFLDDIRMSELSPEEIADIRKERFAFVFQIHFLVPYLTAVENVMTGCGGFSGEGREKAMMLLTDLGLADHADKKIHQLSSGEQQQVAIARALISDPEIIFADEPTAFLDHETARRVFQFLKNHGPERTLIFATHDWSILEGNERTFYLENAKVVEVDLKGDLQTREDHGNEAGDSGEKESGSEKTRFLTRPLHKDMHSSEEPIIQRSAHIRESSLADMERPQRKSLDSNKGSAYIHEESLAGKEKPQRKTIDSNKRTIREQPLAEMERPQRKTLDSHKVSAHTCERSFADREKEIIGSNREPVRMRERSIADMERGYRKDFNFGAHTGQERSGQTYARIKETAATVFTPKNAEGVSPSERAAGARARMASARARVASVREKSARAKNSAATADNEGTDVSSNEGEAYHTQRSVRIREGPLTDTERPQRRIVNSRRSVSYKRADGKAANSLEGVLYKGFNTSEYAVDLYERAGRAERYFANLERKKQDDPGEYVPQIPARIPTQKGRNNPNESVALIRERVLASMKKDEQLIEFDENMVWFEDNHYHGHNDPMTLRDNIAKIREMIFADMRKEQLRDLQSPENASSEEERIARIRERAFADMERRRVERRLMELERIVDSME